MVDCHYVYVTFKYPEGSIKQVFLRQSHHHGHLMNVTIVYRETRRSNIETLKYSFNYSTTINPHGYTASSEILFFKHTSL